MRAPRVASGLKPLTKAELRVVARQNARSLFPSVLVQRLLITLRALEAKGNAKLEHRRDAFGDFNG